MNQVQTWRNRVIWQLKKPKKSAFVVKEGELVSSMGEAERRRRRRQNTREREDKKEKLKLRDFLTRVLKTPL